jgi:DNA-binding transcriptional LysR family regulator
MSDVTLRQLTYFLAVAVTAAARQCHVSPAGVSQALSDLEATLGVPLLLRRRAKGATLTAAGHWVAAEAQEIVARTGALRSVVEQMQGQLIGPLRVGCFTTLSPWLVPSVIEYFDTHHPRVELEIVEEGSDLLQERVLAGDLDVCLLYALHADPEMVVEQIAPVRLRLLLGAEHPLARRDEVHLCELGDFPAALLGLRPARALAETMIRSTGFEPRIRWRSANVETIRTLVARGLAWSVLMGRPAGDLSYDGLPVVYIRIADPLPANSVVAVYPRGAQPPRRVRELIRVCQQTFRVEGRAVQ